MKYKTLKELFTGICDAVRVKKGITEEIDHQDIPAEILDISSVDVSGVTTTTADVVAPKVFVDSDGVEQIGTIPTNSSSNLTADGATVSVPAGYYPTEASKSVETAEQATPSITVDSNGLITAKSTQSAGYVASGTKQATKQLTTQTAKTLTPTKSEQTAVAAGVYTTGAVKVAKIPDSYIQPTGTKSITENGTHDVKSFAAVNVNVAGSGGGGGGAVETCEVSMVHQWGGNDDPELCKMSLVAYDVITNEHSYHWFCSIFDYELEHSVSFNSFKNAPISVIIESISGNIDHVTWTAVGGEIIGPNLTSPGSRRWFLCIPTSSNATFTFASP